MMTENIHKSVKGETNGEKRVEKLMVKSGGKVKRAVMM